VQQSVNPVEVKVLYQEKYKDLGGNGSPKEWSEADHK
jgi:hypothetical protein